MQFHTNVEVIGNPSWRPNTHPTSLVHILNNSDVLRWYFFLFQASL